MRLSTSASWRKNLRGARRQRVPIRICLLLALLFSIYSAARRAVGAWYFRQGSPNAIAAAIRWDPANPEYYQALGTLEHLYANGGSSNQIIQLYWSATHLSPHDAQLWADLAASYDWAGHSDDALEAFQRARRLSPNSPEVNWRLANFYVRRGKIPEALAALRIVLLGDSAAGRKVFRLATNVTMDRKAILEMLPPRAPLFFAYLQFRIERGDLLAAEEIWARIVQLNLPFDAPAAFPYLDALIQHREVRKLEETWSVLAERFRTQIVAPSTSLSNLVTNGNFKLNILNGGLDWRVIAVEGAIVSLDSAKGPDGARALRIEFDGTHNLDYGQVFQYVPVQPKTRYRFAAHVRAEGITTDSGPRLQVCDAYKVGNIFLSTRNLVGSSDWFEERADFTTNADTQLLLVGVVRPASNKFDDRIAGTLWIDGVSLHLAN